jgi:hypothetical protein
VAVAGSAIGEGGRASLGRGDGTKECFLGPLARQSHAERGTSAASRGFCPTIGRNYGAGPSAGIFSTHVRILLSDCRTVNDHLSQSGTDGSRARRKLSGASGAATAAVWAPGRGPAQTGWSGRLMSGSWV